MDSVLAKERAETNKRVAKLNKQTELERLRKEELELKCENYRHTSVWDRIKNYFR